MEVVKLPFYYVENIRNYFELSNQQTNKNLGVMSLTFPLVCYGILDQVYF